LKTLGKALEARLEQDSHDNEDETTDDAVMFVGRPSLFGMAGTVVKGCFLLSWRLL